MSGVFSAAWLASFGLSGDVWRAVLVSQVIHSQMNPVCLYPPSPLLCAVPADVDGVWLVLSFEVRASVFAAFCESV